MENTARSGCDWQIVLLANNGDRKILRLSGGHKGSAVNYGKEYAAMYGFELQSVRRVIEGQVQC